MPRDQTQRDNQQIQDDNQSSGESVHSRQSSGDAQQPISRTPQSDPRNSDTPNQASNKDKAEGDRKDGSDA